MFFRRFRNAAILLLAIGLGYVGAVQGAGDDRDVLMATTTSTDNSGLLGYLLPYLEGDTGVKVKVVAVGTRKALQMGRAGDVDMLLVHAKDAEMQFVEEGYGVDRTELMYNDFVIVGPSDDPAVVGNSSDIGAAMNAISDSKSLFISRGDDSGTHKKELYLWKTAGIEPQGEWYREVGQGMGKTLLMADELSAYTLTDRGTWIFSEEGSSLKIVLEDQPPLFNQYSAIAIDPERHDVNYRGARAIIDWLASNKGQDLIDSYRIGDKKLFHANAN